MTGRNGPSLGLARGAAARNPGGSAWAKIFLSVCQWISYSAHACRLLISPVSTRRRISAHSSMSVYTPASCRPAMNHGRDPHRTAEADSERDTSRSAGPPTDGAALPGLRLEYPRLDGVHQRQRRKTDAGDY